MVTFTLSHIKSKFPPTLKWVISRLFGNVRDLGTNFFQSHLYIFVISSSEKYSSFHQRQGYCWWHEVYRFHNPTSSQQCFFHYCDIKFMHPFHGIPDCSERCFILIITRSESSLPGHLQSLTSGSQICRHFIIWKIFPTNRCGPPDLKY